MESGDQDFNDVGLEVQTGDISFEISQLHLRMQVKLLI